MKTIRGRMKEGSVVVKIFVKPESGFSLKRIARILNEERERLDDVPNAMAFQKIYHGDIKTENCLMTSWNWVYLSDYAGYKPAFLPEDNPADFSFFFDTSSRRTCYLAPERFYKPGVDTEKQKQAEDPKNIFAGLTAAMDIFSAG
ncbi:Serine/threonine-protein kinase, partial [Lobosporangium transversale]